MNVKFYNIISSVTIRLWKEYKNSFINNFILTIIKGRKISNPWLNFFKFCYSLLLTLRASFPDNLITAKPEIPGAVASANIDIKK